MNHIAHFLFAPRTVEGVAGTLLADFHRGPIGEDLPSAVQGAIALHRAIDGRTDRHAVTRAARALFDDPLRRYAGVALDLYFDHCLVRDWPAWAQESFEWFVADVYRHLGHGLDAGYVPPGMRRLAGAMMAENWLGAYAQFEGVEAALGRLGYAIRRRFDREVDLLPLAGELRRLAPQLDAAFAALFPDLRRFAVAITAADRDDGEAGDLGHGDAVRAGSASGPRHRGHADHGCPHTLRDGHDVVQPITFHRVRP